MLFLPFKKGKKVGAENEASAIYIYIHIYIYAVKLKTGPIFALFKVKNWSIFYFFFCFLFLKISFSLQKEEDFWKTSKKKQQKKHNF